MEKVNEPSREEAKLMSDRKPEDKGAGQPGARAADFKLERYKYILQQVHSLNENLHKYLTLFQTLATAIVTASVAVFVSWRKFEVSADVARASIRGLLVLLVLLAVFVIISVLAGIFSWLDYRREEGTLLDQEVEAGFRKPPRPENLWRWYETYVLIFILVFVLAAIIFTESQIIPLIR